MTLNTARKVLQTELEALKRLFSSYWRGNPSGLPLTPFHIPGFSP